MTITRPIVVALALLLLCGGAAGQPLVLRYAQAQSAHKSIFSLPVALAEREGFFAREGLDFRVVIPIPGGGERMIGALHDDTADLAHVATPFLVSAALGGSDAVAIAAEFNDPIYTLVARPEIARVADLKGRVVGMADAAGSIAHSMRKLFALHGIGQGELKIRNLDGTPARLACLRRGECDAVPLGQPQDLVAQGEGFRRLGASNDAVPAYLYTVTAARRSWAAKHPDAVVRYVRALAASFAAIRDPAKRGVVTQVIVEATGAPPRAAEGVLDLYAGKKVLPQRGEIDLEGLGRVIAFMGESGQLKAPLPPAERFAEPRYLRLAGIR